MEVASLVLDAKLRAIQLEAKNAGKYTRKFRIDTKESNDDSRALSMQSGVLAGRW